MVGIQLDVKSSSQNNVLELQGDEVLRDPFPSPFLWLNYLPTIYFPLAHMSRYFICMCPGLMHTFSYSIDKYFTLHTCTSVIWLTHTNTEVTILTYFHFHLTDSSVVYIIYI